MKQSSHYSLHKAVSAVTAMAALLLIGNVPASAQTYIVSLDTTGLKSTDSYAVDLQLNQGDTTVPDSGNVTISNFLFGGGGSPDTTTPIFTMGSGVSGTLSSGVSLTISPASPYNYFSQNFYQGSSLSFQVNASHLNAGIVQPDEFEFDLFDNTTGGSIATTDATGASSPQGIELFTLSPSAQGYSAKTYGYTANSVFYPTQATLPSAAPEASTSALFGIVITGLSGLLLRARRKSALSED